MLPGFSRPGFPEGLKVLLISSEDRTNDITEELSKLQYLGTVCSSCEDAATHLKTNPQDIVLAEASMLMDERQKGLPQLLEQLKQLPLVLMSEDAAAEHVMSGIKLGAVDFLEKPISQLKLKNIWQHVVRKLMDSSKSPNSLPSASCGTKRSDSFVLCPKTPSPAGSDDGCIVASAGSKDQAVDSSASEATYLPSVQTEGTQRPPRHARKGVFSSTAAAVHASMPANMVPCTNNFGAPMCMPSNMMPTPYPTWMVSQQPSNLLCATEAMCCSGLMYPASDSSQIPLPPNLLDVSPDPNHAPIGLSLRKSSSLLDLLNQHVQQAAC